MEELFTNVIDVYQDLAMEISDLLEVEMGADWCCETDDYIIYVPALVCEEDSETFLHSVYKRINKGLVMDIEDFMFSFLHEIGHFESAQGDLISKIFRPIANKLADYKITKGLSNLIYYNLPEEKNATQWACDFIKNNHLLVAQYQQKIIKEYEKIYTLAIDKQ